MAPEQVKAIEHMQPLVTKKQIQARIIKLAALNRFISRYSDRLRPFFIALKGASAKGWGPECDQAFNQGVHSLPPLSLSQPVNGEEVYLYLAASAMAVSATLV